MKKDMIFFAEKGITSTSANTVCNLAKESLQSMESALANISFCTIKVGVLDSAIDRTIQTNNTTEEISQIPTMLEKIAKTKSLIAWLREAIKARDNLKKELQAIGVRDYTENILGDEYPECPTYPAVLTEDDYYGNLDIKTRNRYYYLETVCSTIGKYIHPDGTYSMARKNMKDMINNPYKISGTGRDALIYERKVPANIPDVVESTFFSLQDQHRENQKQLNSIKFECEKAIQVSQAAADSIHNADVAEYKAKIAELNAKYRTWYNNENTKLSSLKIVIPESLQSIYEEISKLGK